jgi:hypothetical protein
VSTPSSARRELFLTRFWPVVTSVVLAVGLVLARGRPSTHSDAGIFLSVAARLLDGDRLYIDVWDNKDPLFFYTFAAALAGGDWRLPFLLDAVWLMLAGAGVYYLLRSIGATATTASIGLVSYPVLLTGAYYYAGYSMLPALALAPVAGWAWARGRFIACGVVVGVAALYKANLVLVVAAAPAALAVLEHGMPRPRGTLARAGAGLAATLLVAAGVLALRGELGGYLSTLRGNVSYAGDVLAATGRPTGLYGHVWSAAGVTDYTLAIVALGAGGAAYAVWSLARSRDDATAPIAALFLAVAGATGITLAATAVWDHHAQLVAYPGALLTVLAASALERRVVAPRMRIAGVGAAVVVVVAVFGGFSAPPGIEAGSSWRSPGRSDTARALKRARTAVAGTAGNIGYAVLGSNHEQGHAAFLDGSWQLVCPRFHQYPFSIGLDAVAACIRTRRPALVLVDSPLAPDARAPAWSDFVREVKATLRSRYVRLPTVDTGGAEIWRRR